MPGRQSESENRLMARKLYVGNLPYDTNDQDLGALFATAGTVDSVNVMRDRPPAARAASRSWKWRATRTRRRRSRCSTSISSAAAASPSTKRARRPRAAAVDSAAVATAYGRRSPVRASLVTRSLGFSGSRVLGFSGSRVLGFSGSRGFGGPVPGARVLGSRFSGGPLFVAGDVPRGNGPFRIHGPVELARPLPAPVSA